MKTSANDGQFAEVFVKSDLDTILIVSASEDFIVTRIVRPVPGSYYVVTGCFQFLARLAPHASVQQQPQAWLTANVGSMRSCPTILRA